MLIGIVNELSKIERSYYLDSLGINGRSLSSSAFVFIANKKFS